MYSSGPAACQSFFHSFFHQSILVVIVLSISVIPKFQLVSTHKFGAATAIQLGLGPACNWVFAQVGGSVFCSADPAFGSAVRPPGTKKNADRRARSAPRAYSSSSQKRRNVIGVEAGGQDGIEGMVNAQDGIPGLVHRRLIITMSEGALPPSHPGDNHARWE